MKRLCIISAIAVLGQGSLADLTNTNFVASAVFIMADINGNTILPAQSQLVLRARSVEFFDGTTQTTAAADGSAWIASNFFSAALSDGFQRMISSSDGSNVLLTAYSPGSGDSTADGSDLMLQAGSAYEDGSWSVVGGDTVVYLADGYHGQMAKAGRFLVKWGTSELFAVSSDGTIVGSLANASTLAGFTAGDFMFASTFASYQTNASKFVAWPTSALAAGSIGQWSGTVIGGTNWLAHWYPSAHGNGTNGWIYSQGSRVAP